MAKTNTCRKWQITINNPEEHGYTDAVILDNLSNLRGETLYWCFCHEIGESETPHVHIFVYRESPIRFNTLLNLFPGCHLERARGTTQENRAYVLKDGDKFNKQPDGSYNYLDSTNHRHSGVNYSETFQESGDCPIEEQGVDSAERLIVDMILNGATDGEIVNTVPKAFKDLDKIQRVRSMYRDKDYADKWRDLTTAYIYGTTGSGKTRSVMEKYGYSNVYRVTDYSHPFDNYNGQDVIIFEEFRSSLKYSDMLNYLDGYPLELPCRYFNRQACFTKVFIISNIPPHEQYPKADKESFAAFWRRVHSIQHFVQKDFVVTYESYDKYMECEKK